MLGMTRKQFLKRSKKTLNETGGLLLLIREIMDKKSNGHISNEEASKQFDNIRKSIESIFFEFEDMNPPSKFVKLHLRILRLLISLQETVNLNMEYLSATSYGMKDEARKKLNESRDHLEEFRIDFHSICDEVTALLAEK